MPSEPKRRLFKLLRRTSKSARVAQGRTAEEENAFWSAHARALTGSRDAAEATQRIASSLAKQRAAVDAAQDRARSVSVRAQELLVSAKKLSEVFERLGLVALNAGLEGARLGEGIGRSLTLVADEVREHTSRGGESARELISAHTDCVAELAQLGAQFDRIRDSSTEATHDATRAAGLAVEGERALAEIEVHMKKTTGTDPETARAMAEATAHARSLVLALTQISGKVPRALVVNALRPLLEPLSRVLDGDEAPEDDEASE
jgi:methyl-accepting chemotaxis protein